MIFCLVPYQLLAEKLEMIPLLQVSPALFNRKEEKVDRL
jgi:hypothetical protein